MIGDLGTLVSAFSVFYSGTSTRVKSKARAFAINVIVGLLQLATFVIIVGWIWSILWGMTFIQLAGIASVDCYFAELNILMGARIAEWSTKCTALSSSVCTIIIIIIIVIIIYLPRTHTTQRARRTNSIWQVRQG